MYNRAVRCIFNVPYTTHRYIIPLLTDCVPIMERVVKLSEKMAKKMLSSCNEAVAFLARMCIRTSQSLLGSNMAYIRNFEKYVPSEEQLAIGLAIRELLGEPPEGLSQGEVHSLVELMCIT